MKLAPYPLDPRYGTHIQGERSVLSKLTVGMVRDARRRAANGETHVSIAESMPVDRSVLSRAVRRDTWAHV